MSATINPANTATPSDATALAALAHDPPKREAKAVRCKSCSALFVPQRATARYCGDACRQRAYRARQRKRLRKQASRRRQEQEAQERRRVAEALASRHAK